MSKLEELIINFEENGKSYTFSEKDFQRVEEYCENECLGFMLDRLGVLDAMLIVDDADGF